MKEDKTKVEEVSELIHMLRCLSGAEQIAVLNMVEAARILNDAKEERQRINRRLRLRSKQQIV